MNGRHTFYRTLIVAFTLAGLYVLWELAEIIVVLVGAIIVASAIRPFVNQLAQLGVPRGLAILLIYLGGLLGVGVLLAVAIPPLFGVIRELIQEGSLIYRVGNEAWAWAARLGYQDIGQDLRNRILTEWAQLGTRARFLAEREGPSVLQSTAAVLGQLILGLVVAYYWLTERDDFQKLLLSITPIRHRALAETIFTDVEQTLGDYLRGTGLLMLSIGVSSFIGLLILGVPYALPLALLAGLFEAVPMVGAYLGALPAVLVAFTNSPATGVLTILLFVVIQFLENNILVPRIYEHSVGLNPLMVLIAVVAGATLNGLVGALLAIPVVGALHVMLRYLVVDPMIEEAAESHEEHGVPIFDVEKEEDEESKAEGIIIARS
ncbi:MAG: AI-2E family transporter [Chloroflexota bacterium]|nr:AI-2E family transporter [Chloroflexota bacterium]